ncbi:MAG: alpha/beta fold hydrolase [Alphaproteobacteria bacterium]|nr:alpha/beta fold hydrolase [Alphaproteobacteria bacterium]
MMKQSLLCIILLCMSMMNLAHAFMAIEPQETVVLLHGIARTGDSLSTIEHVLKENNYRVVNITYPSQKKNLKDIAKYLNDVHLTKKFWATQTKVHIVTHSMGGLVARQYLEQYKDTIDLNKLGRVVMMAPPNKGSEISDLIHNTPVYNWYYGPAGQELTTEEQAKNMARPTFYELGIIAGKKEWTYFVAAWVTPGKSDGRVTVESTKLDGMKDHVSLSATHTFIMEKPLVHQHILYFLKTGEFQHEK